MSRQGTLNCLNRRVSDPAVNDFRRHLRLGSSTKPFDWVGFPLTLTFPCRSD